MNETDYNARLYEKMKAEQDKYRDWLLHQEPSEILNHTYENDLRQPSYEKLLKLSRLFKVTTDWLLGNTPQASFHFSSLTEEQTALILGMIREFEKANEK